MTGAFFVLQGVVACRVCCDNAIQDRCSASQTRQQLPVYATSRQVGDVTASQLFHHFETNSISACSVQVLLLDSFWVQMLLANGVEVAANDM